MGPPRLPYQKLRPGPGQGAGEVAEHQCDRIQRALIETAAADGYQAVKVRELARRAGVSSRTFYQHYSDKEECFLRAHEHVIRRLVGCILVSQAEAGDWRERVCRTVASLMGAMARDPAAARLALIEVYAVGPTAQEQLRRAERTLESLVTESFAGAADEVVMPPLMVKGIVAGLLCIARTRILDGRARELPMLTDSLTEWTLSFRDPAVTDVCTLDRRHEWSESAAKYLPAPAGMRERAASSSLGSRATILHAVGKLVASEGYESLSTRAIRVAAGASPRNFKANFADVEDCFLQAVATRTREALQDADNSRAGAPTWTAGIYRAVTSISRRVAIDPPFATLCFDKALAPGLAGARNRAALMGEVGERLRDRPSHIDTDDVAVEASIGAIWGVLHQLVAAGRAGHAARSTAVLAYLAAAPMAGAERAATDISREIENASAQKLPSVPLDAILVDGQGHHGLPTTVMTTVTK